MGSVLCHQSKDSNLLTLRENPIDGRLFVPAQLKAFAFQSNVPLAEYVHDMVHGHILERGGTFRERGAALRALINTGKAYQEGVPVSEYVREMVHDHILQRGARFRETGARLRVLSNAVKAWLIAYHECVALAAGLPGKESLTATWGRR